jgi:hypothetical protein
MSMQALLVVTLLLAAPVAAQAFNYVESTDGDIASFDETAPTPLGFLDAGTNVLSGTLNLATDWGDVFSVQVPLGLAITGIEAQIAGHTGGFDAGTKVFETPVYFGLGSHAFSATGSYSYSAIVPLAAAGPYGFSSLFLNASSGSSYAWQWTITVPEPSAGALSLTAGAALLLAAGARRCQRTRLLALRRRAEARIALVIPR